MLTQLLASSCFHGNLSRFVQQTLFLKKIFKFWIHSFIFSHFVFICNDLQILGHFDVKNILQSLYHGDWCIRIKTLRTWSLHCNALDHSQLMKDQNVSRYQGAQYLQYSKHSHDAKYYNIQGNHGLKISCRGWGAQYSWQADLSTAFNVAREENKWELELSSEYHVIIWTELRMWCNHVKLI